MIELCRRVFCIQSLFRRAILSWSAAVLVEYLLLSEDLRRLDRLKGLGEMSPVRVLLFFLLGMVLLSLIACRADTAKTERWLLAGVLCVLAAVSLRASFTVPFLAACLLLLALSPNLSFSLTFMSENLYLPLLLWTFWATHRLLSGRNSQ